jgi:hypothetical protein
MKTSIAPIAVSLAALGLLSGCHGTHDSHGCSAGHGHATDRPAHAAPAKDIVDTAVSAGAFNTLVTAVRLIAASRDRHPREATA